jgi:hypothetical protein
MLFSTLVVCLDWLHDRREIWKLMKILKMQMT